MSASDNPALIMERTEQSIVLGSKPTTIGRKENNLIILQNDRKVSRYHARIYWQSGHFWLQDLNSSNGTYLNGEAIDKATPLHHGDKISIGETVFTLHLPHEMDNLPDNGSDEEEGHILTLGYNPVTIGRKGDNTIVLAEDPQLSRRHARITYRQGQYILEDLSANGTYLNGARVRQPQQLTDGATLQVGQSRFIIHIQATPPQMASLLIRPQATDNPVSIPIFQPLNQQKSQNPYVGPRTFNRLEGDLFFGREREARELTSLVIAERLVVFYAQSGAGKSSLINTRVVPQLQEAGFSVLPIGRVSGRHPTNLRWVKNIFIFNLLLSLDESDRSPEIFSQMSLSEFLNHLTSPDGEYFYYDETLNPQDAEAMPYVLIIDQFEELISTHPERWTSRTDFFRQLHEAMLADPMLWVILTLREDYIATLEPYAALLPNKMRARFHMQRMEYEAALEAVKRPAMKHERVFQVGVAEKLVDNLRQVRIHGQRDTVSGQFIEPVQLQIVCRQLWYNLHHKSNDPISEQDLQVAGDVDTALADFYEQAVSHTLKHIDIPEFALRRWFDEHLITEAKTRGIVYEGELATAGLPNKAVRLLAQQHLLRAEIRAGGVWYELIHDRFLGPIEQANRDWWLAQSVVTLQKALEDNKQGKPDPTVQELLKLGQMEIVDDDDESSTGWWFHFKTRFNKSQL